MLSYGVVTWMVRIYPGLMTRAEKKENVRQQPSDQEGLKCRESQLGFI